jgi:hypothetical protein
MKHLHLTLGYLKDQRAKLDAAISVLETALGGSANGNGHQATQRTVETALALHEARALALHEARPAPTRRPRVAIRQTVVEIVRKAGPQGLLIGEIAEAARAQGITNLRGIGGLVNSGRLKRTGKTRGQFRYSLGKEA